MLSPLSRLPAFARSTLSLSLASSRQTPVEQPLEGLQVTVPPPALVIVVAVNGSEQELSVAAASEPHNNHRPARRPPDQADEFFFDSLADK